MTGPTTPLWQLECESQCLPQGHCILNLLQSGKHSIMAHGMTMQSSVSSASCLTDASVEFNICPCSVSTIAFRHGLSLYTPPVSQIPLHTPLPKIFTLALATRPWGRLRLGICCRSKERGCENPDLVLLGTPSSAVDSACCCERIPCTGGRLC